MAGQDLVEWQLKVASGNPLPCRQADLKINGHTFEARIYAENPAAGFLPATGRFYPYLPLFTPISPLFTPIYPDSTPISPLFTSPAPYLTLYLTLYLTPDTPRLNPHLTPCLNPGLSLPAPGERVIITIYGHITLDSTPCQASSSTSPSQRGSTYESRRA